MEQWVRQTLSADLTSAAILPAAFLLGVLGSVGSCCTLPVIGAVAGYAGGLGQLRSRRELLIVGGSFLLGTIVSLAVLGAVVGFGGGALAGDRPRAAGLPPSAMPSQPPIAQAASVLA